MSGMLKRLTAHRERLRKHWYKNAHRIVIGVAGGSILLIGIILIFIPGPPATLTMAMGIALLGTEFLWAERFLKRSKAYLKDKLPDSQGGRINWLFAKAKSLSRRAAKWLHQYLVKPLTPRRKRT